MQDNFRCMKRITLIFVFLAAFSFQTSAFSQDDKTGKIKLLIEEQNTFEMTVSENKLILKNAPVGKQVEIISIIGTKIKIIKISSPDLIQELNLPRGIYLLRMEEMVKKTLIK